MQSNVQPYPKALPYLFLTEMWERYGFYVVQGMLVLYLTQARGFSDEKSFTISGTYLALAYVAPIIGGFLADRLLGFKTAIFYGGCFLFLGYLILLLPGRECFYFGLGTAVVGTGLFKPNISSLLGALYDPEDPARDTGFTIFYVGINLGALLAGISSGFIKQHFGWQAAFALASVGMLLGLLIFRLGRRWLKGSVQKLSLQNKTYLRKPWFFLYCFLSIVLLHYILINEVLAKWLLPSVGVILFIFLIVLTLKQDREHRERLLILDVLIVSSVVFWMLFLQLFMSSTLFIERLVDKNIGGIHLPTTLFYSLESVFIILFGPFFAWSWQALNNNDLNPSPLFKFVLALVFAGLCFVVMAISTYFMGAGQTVNVLWIVLAYSLLTIGELLLSPIGLSAVTTHSPPHLAGMMMGIWFVATGFGGAFAGWLAKFSNIPKEATAQTMVEIYRSTFFHYSYIAFTVAIILFGIQLSLKKRSSD